MTTRKDIANAFRAARKRIESKNNYHICIALEDSRHFARREAKRIIERRLGRYVSVTHWIDSKGLITETTSSSDMRDYRLRWLDALIQEFDKS